MAKDKYQESYEKGKEDAKKAGPLDEFAHALSKSLPATKTEKSYDAGWEDGIEEKSSVCFLTTACVEYAGLPDNCWELQMIRQLRDEYIRKLPDGNAFLAEYYTTAPAIVTAIRSQPNHQTVFDALLHRARAVARMIENGRLEEALAECRNQFLQLKLRYLGSDASGLQRDR